MSLISLFFCFPGGLLVWEMLVFVHISAIFAVGGGLPALFSLYLTRD
jgi:hypothetical protein